MVINGEEKKKKKKKKKKKQILKGKPKNELG